MATLISPTRSIVGTSLGTLYVRLTVSPQELLNGMGNAERAVAGATTRMTAQLQSFAVAAGSAFAAVAAASAYQFAKFDQAMTESVAIMGKVTDDMRKKMEDLALSLSERSNKSSIELAKTYYELAQAGYNVEQSIRALPAVMNFATAAIIDTKDATQLLSEAQAALGLKTDDATQNMEGMVKIADVLSKASFLTTATIKDMGDALTNKAAGAMRAFGMSLEEGVAILSTFIQRGYSGRTAGQALYTVLRDLQRAAINQPQAWRDLGVAVYDASGQFRPMADIVEALTQALSGATDEEKRMAVSLLGMTDRSLAASLALLGSADTMRRFEAELRNAGGTTQQVSDTVLTSFQNQLKMTLHVLQNTAIEIGRQLAPSILAAAQAIAEMLKDLQALEVEAGLLSATIATGMDVLKTFVVGLAAVWTVLKTVATTLAYTATFIVEGWIAAIQAAVEIAKIWYDSIVNGLIPAIKSLGTAIVPAAKMMFSLFTQDYASAAQHAAELSGTKFAETFSEAYVKAFDQYTSVLKNAGSRILELAKGLGGDAAEQIKAQWVEFSQTVLKYFPATEDGAKKVATATAQIGEAATNSINQVTAAGKAVEAQVNKVSDAVRRLIDSAKAEELMKILGTPETGTVRPVSAKDLMDSMEMGEGGKLDSSRAVEMLRKAGLGVQGGSIGSQGMILDPTLSQTLGIDQEIQAQEMKLKMLEELGRSEVKLTEEVQKKKLQLIEDYNARLKKLHEAQTIMVLRAGQNMFDELALAAKGFAGEQSDLYKAMFAASKAFAIAEAVVKIQQGIANAASLPWPSNLVAMAQVVSATASIVSTIQSIKLAFAEGKATGGPVTGGTPYLVGERGPELFVPRMSGDIVPNHRLGGETQVVVHNYSSSPAEVSERTENNMRMVEVVIGRVKKEIGAEIREGRGTVSRSLESSYRLQRSAQ